MAISWFKVETPKERSESSFNLSMRNTYSLVEDFRDRIKAASISLSDALKGALEMEQSIVERYSHYLLGKKDDYRLNSLLKMSLTEDQGHIRKIENFMRSKLSE